MPRPKRTDAEKFSFRLNKVIMARLAEIARRENRTTTAQLERWVAEKIREYDGASETKPGNRTPARQATHV